MQKGPFPKNIWQSVRQGLSHSTRKALQAGVQRSQLILDPGFGFGKSLLQNFELLARLDRLASFRLPILVGTSRKSFLQRTLGKGSLVSKSSPWPLTVQGIPPEIMVGTAASVVAAILSGAHIVRVHDVRQMLPAVRIADVILNPFRWNRLTRHPPAKNLFAVPGTGPDDRFDFPAELLYSQKANETIILVGRAEQMDIFPKQREPVWSPAGPGWKDFMSVNLRIPQIPA